MNVPMGLGNGNVKVTAEGQANNEVMKAAAAFCSPDLEIKSKRQHTLLRFLVFCFIFFISVSNNIYYVKC
jgi:hypothetical protein